MMFALGTFFATESHLTEEQGKQEEKATKIPILVESALQTGDIILFHGTGTMSYLLEYFGRSKYSHVGIIVKNPSFINPYIEDGLYVLEAKPTNGVDAEDGKIKSGVTLHRLDDVLAMYSKGSVYVRHVECVRNEEFYKKFIKVHYQVHEKPYDLNLYDWICAEYNINCPLPEENRFKLTTTFWCSALASYVLCELGVIQNKINWSLIAPREFSSEGKLIFLCGVSDEKLLY